MYTAVDYIKAHIDTFGHVSRFKKGAWGRPPDLYGADLYGANLHEADLYGANLHEANLQRANLYGANLYGAKNIVSVSGLGDEGRYAYFVRHADCIMAQAGCFWGTTDELLEASLKKSGSKDSKHYQGYAAAVAYAMVMLQEAE